MINNKKYDNLYFLHINKTAGHFILNNIINPITDILHHNGVIVSSQHHCWNPVNKYTYVLSCLRDPVKRTVSHFCYDFKNFNDDLSIKDLSIDSFMLWIEKNKNGISNFQSKSLVFKEVNKKDLFFLEDKNFCNYKINTKELKDNIKNINILINDKMLNIDKCEIIKEKILKDFFIDIDFSYIPKRLELEPDIGDNINDKSSILYNTLSINEIDYIQKINYLDMEIYHSDIYKI